MKKKEVIEQMKKNEQEMLKRVVDEAIKQAEESRDKKKRIWGY